MVLVSKEGGHKQWLEAEEGGDMHAAYSYALAKQAAKLRPAEMGYEVCRAYAVTICCTSWLSVAMQVCLNVSSCPAALLCPLFLSVYSAI